ncbi:pteridine-dependent deoxygenase [Lysobacteraceae bacterium NML03-0222]|nr:pteridine-dependent deoxygenase [Xanthomonadaceae bacterium NML03-0222]
MTLPSIDLPQLHVDYVAAAQLQDLLQRDDVLAVFGFGQDAPHLDDPRWLRVPLNTSAHAPLEVWYCDTPVAYGRDGNIQWSCTAHFMFGAVEVAELDGDICSAAEQAYAQLELHLEKHGFTHILRIWNYMGGITEGEGDAERYREFCVGRVRGMSELRTDALPAATAIGRSDGERILQVYWLAAKNPGQPVENPRQLSAYHYPRQYGPQSPSFARAMLPPDTLQTPLMLSGTAAIVGHQSQHTGEVLKQLDEIFVNFDALLNAARQHRPTLPAKLDASSRLKVYVRDAADLPQVERALAERLGTEVPYMIVHAAICRRELAIEIDGVHGHTAQAP